MKYVYNGYINWRREGMSTTKNDKLVEGKEPTGFEVGCSYEVISPVFDFNSFAN